MKRIPRPFFFWLALLLLALDQASKHWILASADIGRWGMESSALTVIPGFFNVVFVRNTGIAFGLFAGNNHLWLAVAACFVVVAVLIGRTLDWSPAGTNFVAALIVAGALGNLIDRARLGFVVDFLDFHWGPHHWPAFNVADSAITVAVTLLVWRAVFPPHRAPAGD